MTMLLKNVLHLTGVFFSYVFPIRVISLLQKSYNVMYTGYHSRKFGKFDKSSTIKSPVAGLLNAEYIEVGKHTGIGKNARLSCWLRKGNTPSIAIGDFCTIGDDVHITAVDSIHIGDGFLCGSNVLISDNSHGDLSAGWARILPVKRPLEAKGPIAIGNNVWVGNNVCILSNVTIGDNVIIGANSVVTHNVPSNSVVAGAPAKIIKQI